MRSLYAGMPKRKPSPRLVRRLRGRAHERLVADLERLARLAPGGAPDRPLVVEAPSQVEPIAEGTVCPLCEGALRLVTHAAETHEGMRLRVAHVRCTACGVRRALYFRLARATLN
jgi:hypothetical protein